MTTPKRKSLAALSEEPPAGAEIAVPDKPANTPATKPRSNGRDGQKNISGWFPLAVSYELEELRLERTKALGRKVTLQDLQAEAFNDLFKKYGRPELAPTREG